MALETADLDLIKGLIVDGTKPETLKLHIEGVVRDIVTAAVADAVKSVAESVAKVEQTVAAFPVKAEDVQKLVTDQVTAGLSQQAQQAQQATAAAATAKKIEDARNAFLSEHGKKLPEAYRALIPLTDDAAQLQAALATATGKLEADLKEIGVALPGMGSAANGNSTGNLDAAAAAAAAESSKGNPARGLADVYAKAK